MPAKAKDKPEVNLQQRWVTALRSRTKESAQLNCPFCENRPFDSEGALWHHVRRSHERHLPTDDSAMRAFRDSVHARARTER